MGEALSIGFTVWMLDSATGGRLGRWVGRKLSGLVAYLAMALDAAHAGRETIAMAEKIREARR